MQPSDIFGVVWRRRWMILVAVVLGVAAVVSVGRPSDIIFQEYDATATVTTSNGYPPETVVLYAVVARTTTQITERVAADLGDGYDPQELQGLVSVQEQPQVGTIRISVQNRGSAEEASRIVDSYVTHLVAYGRDRGVSERDQDLANLQVRRDTLQQAAQDLQGRVGQGGSDVADRVLESQLASTLNSLSQTIAQIDELRFQTEADLTPLRAVGPADVLEVGGSSDPLGSTGRLVVGVGLALVLSVGLALVLHRFDTSIYKREDAEAAFALPVLAEIPKLRRRSRKAHQVVTRTSPTSPAAEAFRLLRSSLSQIRGRQLRRLEEAKRPIPVGTVLLVASPDGGTGRSTVVVNLAAAFVDAGGQVLVISGDLRSPTVHEFLGVPDGGRGLADVVIDPQPEEDLQELFRPTTIDGISLLLHGSPVQNPGETLASSVELFELARQHFDLVIVDSPPILAGNDVSEVVSLVDLVLLVARVGQTAMEDGQLAQKLLSQLEVPACGLVLVGGRAEVGGANARRGQGLVARFRKQDRSRAVNAAPSRSLPAAGAPGPVSPGSIPLGPRRDEPDQEAAARSRTDPAPDRADELPVAAGNGARTGTASNGGPRPSAPNGSRAVSSRGR